ncbi:DUF5709 domain-containing protein [Modestobacter sp. URMC 112]
MDPFVFGSDGTDPEEDTGVLEPEDTLVDPGGIRDVLDTGWSPAERPWAATDWGTTDVEEATGERLAGRLARELPDEQADEWDGLGDASDTDGELVDDEVGALRAGRLVGTVETCGDVEPELYAVDAGIDSGAASAEEAAVHLVPQDDEGSSGWAGR